MVNRTSLPPVLWIGGNVRVADRPREGKSQCLGKFTPVDRQDESEIMGNNTHWKPTLDGRKGGFVARMVQVNYKPDCRLLNHVKMGNQGVNFYLTFGYNPFMPLSLQLYNRRKSHQVFGRTWLKHPNISQLFLPLSIIYIYIYKNIFNILYIYIIRECKSCWGGELNSEGEKIKFCVSGKKCNLIASIDVC